MPCAKSYTSGPGWLKNLYFAYLLVLRAVEKAESYWEAHGFYTGNTTEDIGVGEAVAEMVQAAKLVAHCTHCYRVIEALMYVIT